MGKGSRYTMNAVVSEAQNRARVDASIFIPGGTTASSDGMVRALCEVTTDVLNDAARKLSE